MSNALKLYSQVKDGHLSDQCRMQIKNFLKTVTDPYVNITVQPRKKTRSISQNGYYFGVVIPLVQQALTDLGNNVDSEDVHEFLKTEIGKLTKYIKMPDGSFKPILGSTRKMTTVEFEEYLEKVRIWTADTLGVIIPMPNEDLTEGE